MEGIRKKAGIWMLGVLLAFFVLLFVVFLLVWPPTTSGDVATWAQAVSTTAAVVVALFVALWQQDAARNREETLRLKAKADRCEAAFQLGHYIRTVADKVIAHTSRQVATRVYLTNAAGELDAIGVALDKYNPADFASYRELKPLIALMSARAAMLQQLNHALVGVDANNVSAALEGAFRGFIENIKSNVEEMKVLADEAKAAIPDRACHLFDMDEE
ncbi:hypothetical protein ACFPOE_11510 [Caenimonas terrae]|uniref:LemA family protein n=1 Tax=Caenimonas terrae TaxID=696074 RepID=A0ABW0NC55_9BURK